MHASVPFLFAVAIAALSQAVAPAMASSDPPRSWIAAWPNTDFSLTNVPFSEILSGGPPKNGIPSIDDPAFVAVQDAEFLSPNEPVITLELGGEARAYPVQILMWHEIVNDTVAGTPVAVTYCPLCNSAIVFERTLDGEPVTFGTTGKLRHSDLIMYDRASESWWQQFTGRAIVGEKVGETLTMIPSRMEAFADFALRHPAGEVLARPQNISRPYGSNPYAGYDTRDWPFLFRGQYDDPVPPLTYVVSVGEDAWPLSLLRERGSLEYDGLTLTWRDGMTAALDEATIRGGRSIGSVDVTRDGAPVVFHLPFAFAFKAFEPGGTIHTK